MMGRVVSEGAVLESLVARNLPPLKLESHDFENEESADRF